MVVSAIGGLIAATILSLLVVPAFYLVTDRIVARLGGRRAEEALEASSPPPSPFGP